MKTNEIFKTVTDKMVNHLKEIQEGKTDAKWIKDWTPGKSPWPTNATTHNQYHGMNAMNLFLERMVHGYAEPLWLTFNQKNTLSNELGVDLRIRRGEKATPIIRVVDWVKADERDSDDPVRRKTMKVYMVFNIEQMDNVPEELLPSKDISVPVLADTLKHHHVDLIHSRTDNPHYQPANDRIVMPPADKFTSTQAYAATLLHELTHWTGHKSRLKRLQLRENKDAYAYEELIAELGSAFLCTMYGFEANINHACYIDAWIKQMESDDKTLYHAATAAQKAVDFIQGEP